MMKKCMVTKTVCPKSDDCPWWWETLRENPATGETKVFKDCGIRQLPFFLTAVVTASNRPAAEIGEMHSSLVSGLGRLVHTLKQAPAPKQLEN